MKHLFTDIKNIAITVLVALVVLSQFRSCERGNNTPTTTTTIEIDTVYQTVEVEVPVYVPKYQVKIEKEYIEVIVPVDVDTAAILVDYFSHYNVIDTLSLPNVDGGEFGYGVLTDVITQNKIKERSIKWAYEIPTITITETITIYPAPKTQVYIGATAAFDSDNFINSIGGGLLLKNKKDKIYQLTGGLTNNRGLATSPYIGGGIYWKIKWGKNN